mmetsp:Transcript_33404/g.45175  ORF Transcript_33404/g.45175 Transcript_33404/m.45175 type:complete len:200 (-) Transcript_33404:50-649(-)
MRAAVVSSVTSSMMTLVGFTLLLLSACAWASVRGNPSRIHPLSSTSLSMSRAMTMSITRSSGTSSPRSRNSNTFFPSSVARFTFSLRISPVDKCTHPICSLMASHWVPFPAAGGPSRMIRLTSPMKSRGAGTPCDDILVGGEGRPPFSVSNAISPPMPGRRLPGRFPLDDVIALRNSLTIFVLTSAGVEFPSTLVSFSA